LKSFGWPAGSSRLLVHKRQQGVSPMNQRVLFVKDFIMKPDTNGGFVRNGHYDAEQLVIQSREHEFRMILQHRHDDTHCFQLLVSQPQLTQTLDPSHLVIRSIISVVDILHLICLAVANSDVGFSFIHVCKLRYNPRWSLLLFSTQGRAFPLFNGERTLVSGGVCIVRLEVGRKIVIP